MRVPLDRVQVDVGGLKLKLEVKFRRVKSAFPIFSFLYFLFYDYSIDVISSNAIKPVLLFYIFCITNIKPYDLSVLLHYVV